MASPCFFGGLGSVEVLECPVGRVELVTTMCSLNIVESPLLLYSLMSLLHHLNHPLSWDGSNGFNGRASACQERPRATALLRDLPLNL